MTTHSQRDLKDRVMAAARRVPSAVRADARSDARSILQGALALALVLFFALDGLGHAAGRPPWFLAASFAVWATVATIATRGAWRWGAAFVAGSGLQLVTIAFGTPMLLMAASLALARLSPEPVTAGAAGADLQCFALTFATAIYPLAGLTVLRRSTDPLHPIASGAALGAASGAAGGTLVDLWCPVSAPAHIFAGHVLPVAALAMLGALLGDRILALRGSAWPEVPPRPLVGSLAPSRGRDASCVKMMALRNHLLRAT